MNNYTSSITCHQNKSAQNTTLSDDYSEQTCITREPATFPDSFLTNYDHSNTSIPINIPQSHNDPFNISKSNNGKNPCLSLFILKVNNK